MNSRVSMKAAGNTTSRLRGLRREIEYHNYHYHVLDEPKISDSMFDQLMNQLISLERDHPHLQTSDSPTQRVGGRAFRDLGKRLRGRVQVAEHNLGEPRVVARFPFEVGVEGCRPFEVSHRFGEVAQTIFSDALVQVKARVLGSQGQRDPQRFLSRHVLLCLELGFAERHVREYVCWSELQSACEEFDRFFVLVFVPTDEAEVAKDGRVVGVSFEKTLERFAGSTELACTVCGDTLLKAQFPPGIGCGGRRTPPPRERAPGARPGTPPAA